MASIICFTLLGIKGPYPLDRSTVYWPNPVNRFPSGDSVGGQILNMFNSESAKPYISTGESALESADLEPESADSTADPPVSMCRQVGAIQNCRF